MRAMNESDLRWTLTFERTASPYYREAVRQARALPGYRHLSEEQREAHCVPLTVTILPLAERLLRLVAGWRGSVVEAEGLALDGVEMLQLLHTFRCYRRHERSALGTAFCWGLPERGRGRVPCRLIDDVLPWPVPPDYGDPQLLPSLIRALAMGSFAALCPVYDSTSVQEATATWVGGEVAPRPTFERLLGDLDVLTTHLRDG